jgi:hypothetical protein
VAAGLVPPAAADDEVKLGELINADLGREREGLRLGSVRRGRDC